MPLLDHFRPPLSTRRHWQNIHSAWANTIRDRLNETLLPSSFFAEVEISPGPRELFQVQVRTEEDAPRLVATIEFVSPSHKDRMDNRREFATRCGSYLREGIGLIVVDVVTSKPGRLHEDFLKVLQADVPEATQPELFAAAYRTVSQKGTTRLECWVEELRVGKPLPTLPLWLKPDLCVPVDWKNLIRAPA
jgi:hypothetical protein